MYVYVCESHSVMSNSLQPHRLCGPWNSAGQNTGVGSLSLLQGYIHIYITLLKGNKRIYITNCHWVGQKFILFQDVMEEPQRTFWSTQYVFILLSP